MRFLFLALSLFVAVAAFSQQAPEGLFINSKAPDFKAKDQNGNDVRLKDLLKQGPVVLVFFRGSWCPYCNRYLKSLEDSLRLVINKGATLVAVTPEQPEGIAKTIEKTNASFRILYDEGLKIMKAYDVEYELNENAVKRHKNGGIDLEEINGKKNGNYLPIPATYVISKESTVTFRFFNADYKKRPSVKEILDHLDK